MTQHPDTALWGTGRGPAPATDQDILVARLVQAAVDDRAGTYVVFPYCISIVILSFKRSSGIKFVPAGSSRLVAGLPYLLISLLFGWWGIPWGIAWTLQSILVCLGGGRDLTPVVDTLRAELVGEPAPQATVKPMPPTAIPTPVAGLPVPPDSFAALDPTSDAAIRARTDSESVARVVLRAWHGQVPGKEFAESLLAAIRAGDLRTVRGATAMLYGGTERREIPAGTDPMTYIQEETAYMGALGSEVAARLRPVVDGDSNGPSHVALLFARESAVVDAPWASSLAMFDRIPGWRAELQRYG
jgi:hypothetical protein